MHRTIALGAVLVLVCTAAASARTRPQRVAPVRRQTAGAPPAKLTPPPDATPPVAFTPPKEERLRERERLVREAVALGKPAVGARVGAGKPGVPPGQLIRERVHARNEERRAERVVRRKRDEKPDEKRDPKARRRPAPEPVVRAHSLSEHGLPDVGF